MLFKAINEPNKYEPLSPKNIFAFGKLNSRKESTIIICENKIIDMTWFWLTRLIIKKIELISKKWIAKRPLNPSIKLEPFIINKKHNKTKQVWNILFSSQKSKNSKPDLVILISKMLIQVNSMTNIKNKRIFGLIFILKSSKKPKKNNNRVITKYSFKNIWNLRK